MNDSKSIIEKESRNLQQSISKDIAYFYTKHIPPDSTKNNYSFARLPISKPEIKFIDFTRGDYLTKLESKPKLSPYDVLEAEIKDKISQFYSSVKLSEKIKDLKNIPEGFTDKFESGKSEAMQNTIDRMLKDINNGIIRGDAPLSVMNSINSILDKRLGTLVNFVESNCRQLNQYMILWDYKDKGYSKYIFIADGNSCELCDSLGGNVFNIDDAEATVNLPPMPPYCDCATGIVDNDGNIVALLGNQKNDSNAKFDKAYNSNINIHTLSGTYITLVATGENIPFAEWFGESRNITGESSNPNNIDDAKTNLFDAFLRIPEDAKKLFNDFVTQQSQRFKSIDDIISFIDWFTYGYLSANKNRGQVMLDDPGLYNVGNWLTSGVFDTVKGTFNPDEPLSLKHWLDSFDTASIALTSYNLSKNSMVDTSKSANVAKSATEGAGKASRSFGELINDIEQNPNNWKKVGESIVDSTKKGNAGGKSIEEIFTNGNGETIYKHTLTDANGKLIETPHYRPYGKQ